MTFKERELMSGLQERVTTLEAALDHTISRLDALIQKKEEAREALTKGINGRKGKSEDQEAA